MSKEIIQITIPKKRIQLIALVSVILIALALFLWFQRSIDEKIIILHNSIIENQIIRKVFEVISRYGMGLIAFMFGIFAFLTTKSKVLAAYRPLIPFILFTFAFASITGDLLKEIINRARPAASLAGQIANSTISDSPAFPSGHATKSMALALPFALLAAGRDTITRHTKHLTLFCAVLVSYSRIVLQRHYLSDVLGGTAIALIFIPFGVWITNYFYKKLSIDEKIIAIMPKRLGFVFCALSVFLSIL